MTVKILKMLNLLKRFGLTQGKTLKIQNMRLFILILSITLFVGCSNDDNKTQEMAIQPRCLQEFINSILEEDVSTPKRTISSYNYDEQVVYAITPNSFVTEPATIVIDSSCNTICLIGGFAGDNGETPGCEDFENAEFIETVWTDPR